jgi:putative membrane protein (TIGR04086 family)
MAWIHQLLCKQIRSSFLSGLLVAFTIFIVGNILIAILMNAIDLPFFLYLLLIYCCHVLAIFTAVVHTTLRQKKRTLFHGLRISIAYSMIVWILSILFTDTSTNWNTLALFVLAMMIGCASALWAGQQRSVRSRKKASRKSAA